MNKVKSIKPTEATATEPTVEATATLEEEISNIPASVIEEAEVEATATTTEPTDEQLTLEAITLLINNSITQISVTTFVKAMQLMAEPEKLTLPTFKISADLMVSKATKGNGKYKVTDNHSTIIEYLTTVGSPQTKAQIAKGIDKEEGPVLATCQQMRNPNRLPKDRLSMIVTVGTNGKVLHQFYVTDLLQELELEANQIVTTL